MITSLSNIGFATLHRPQHKQMNQSFCDLIISNQSLLSWIEADSIIHVDQFRDIHKREINFVEERRRSFIQTGASITQSIKVVEIHGLILDTFELTGSLISSIQHQRQRNDDIFITVSQTVPGLSPLTKTQLVTYVVHQLLTKRAKLFDTIESLLKDTLVALNTINTNWRDDVLWRLLKILLGNQLSNHTFIIIHQPENHVFSLVFHDFISDLRRFSESTEMSCKILVVGKPLSDSCDAKSLGAVGLGLDASVNDSPSQDCPIKVYQAEASEFQDQDLQPPDSLKAKLATILSLYKIDSTAIQLRLPLVQQHPSLLLQFKSSLFPRTIRGLVAMILNLVPENLIRWVKTGLLWIIFAARPLTRPELAKILAEGERLHNESHEKLVCNEFDRMMCGLVEITVNSVFLASTMVAKELVALLWDPDASVLGDEGMSSDNTIDIPHTSENEDENENNRQSQADEELRQQQNEGQKHDEACHGYIVPPQPHFYLARSCIQTIRYYYETSTVKLQAQGNVFAHASTESNSDFVPIAGKELKRQQQWLIAPSLEYSVRFWLIHIQKWAEVTNNAIPPDVVKFFQDEALVSFWVEIYNPSWKTRQGMYDSTALNICDVAAKLGLDLTKAQDLGQTVTVFQRYLYLQYVEEMPQHLALMVATAEFGEVTSTENLIISLGSTTKETFDIVLRTGSDAAVCSIIESQPAVLRKSLLEDSINVGNAIQLGNLHLLHLASNILEDESVLEYLYPPVLLSIARYQRNLPLDDIWKRTYSQHVANTVGRTMQALHEAALSGHYTMISALLALGLNPNHRDNYRATPLYYAAQNGHYATVCQLLSAGSDVNIANNDRQTPLHVASANGHLNIVKTLLSHHAKRKKKNRHSNTALHLSLYNGHAKIAMVLINDPNQTSPHYSISREGEASVAINATSVINPLGSNTGTSASNRLKFTDILPERAENPVNEQSVNHCGINTQNAEGITPLLLATRRCFSCVVKILLDGGANPNVPGSNGRVPLHYAALSGDEKTF